MSYPLNMLSHLILPKILWGACHYFVTIVEMTKPAFLPSLLPFPFSPSLSPFLPFDFKMRPLFLYTEVGGVRWGIYFLTFVCTLNVNCGQSHVAHP